MTLHAMTLPEPRLPWRQRLGRAACTAGEWALYAALTLALALAELILG